MKTALNLLFLSGILFLFACEEKGPNSTSQEEKSDANNWVSFEKYLSSLEMIELPLIHNPNIGLPEISRGYDKNGFKKYHHSWAMQPLGILYKSDQSTGIIDCSAGDWGLVPFLMTYDLEGNKIDSAKFYSISGRDMAYEAIEHLHINEDLSVTITDTVKRWEIKEDQSDIVEGSMKMKTGKTEFQIHRDGRIKKN